MDKSSDWVVVGRFGRAHGIKGFVTVHSFTDPRENILRYTDWHAYIAKQWQPLKILHLEINDKSILAQIEGYREREQVANLTNVEIAISRSQLPSLMPGEFYWHELVDMQVVNQQGQLFGKVVEIMPTGANDVLVIEGDKRYLIPYLPGKFVIDVDRDQKLIKVDWDMDF
ncbi:Ribosome maturation factor RimM [Legionella massiliensis]|uniref:Ribosome maturation factor RimM n=1 Tax=Legionella massiliensis TaxID=1034943 RepID=A0A078KYF8_9GAMM|nr:ribosome maturation factor RimM [Legionella massiliensis]CDZ77956.1 Ribosome maturation factor RimM [Legionella massiliensis]CEE13694.1 Ribosome maturation factor RimM [Legionella massiliensis]